MKRILVPVDFSKEAEYAAKVAASIARKTDSEIILLHMLELPVNIIDPAEISSINTGPQALFYMKQAHEKFDNFIQKPFFKGIKVVESIQFSMAFAGIIDESKKHNIDLIVMGSQGASGLQEMFIGSNTEKVVRRSTVPVLVVKSNGVEFNIKNIVFASDFKEESKKTFPKVMEFANLFGAKFHFLYVNTIHNFNTTKAIEERMHNFIKDFELKDFKTIIYNDISIENGILSYSNDVKADLIALNTHGRSGLSQLFNGSIGAELTNHALRPVITFKL
ncbi:universal stress protein [Namhaeicola litoreus]|uniref:Universal stress protein n=1 Tax=Namhaeicola litoreus TaxID=1052145 RepID=A0ABW3XXJ3_9FLAO